jgi:UDP-N-acetylmuramoyl-L-alanyl-D-glutamate--2,6-diaminopimelate ligase
MKLAELIKAVEPEEVANLSDQEISGLYHDSRQVRPGGLFFALKGVAADGHRFIRSAIDNGAIGLVVQDLHDAAEGVAVIKVADSRLAMARMATVFHGDPTAYAPLLGITGTNGKTTTTFIIEAILASADLPAAVLGTISYRFGSAIIEASHTTPESTELQAAFRKLADAGARAFVMEVSSHALEQKRVDGCRFDVGVFSNLTRDHLDYHGSMESYLEAKKRLFAELLRPDVIKPVRRAVVNMDDPVGEVIAAASACPVITYAIDSEADVRPVRFSCTVNGITGLIATPKGEFEFSSKLLGRFNLSNILSAVAAAVAFDLPLESIKRGVDGHARVPGRLERVENDHGVTCLVDYAHTGDALENVLETLKEIATGRIITVFGCGGDRDRGKRPVMGKIAGERSDLSIITSDNPRTESPETIVEEIRQGVLPLKIREYELEELGLDFRDKGFIVILDRREAIRKAAGIARSGDLLLIAGKGHEDYQIIGAAKHHFDDREEAAKAFGESAG